MPFSRHKPNPASLPEWGTMREWVRSDRTRNFAGADSAASDRVCDEGAGAQPVIVALVSEEQFISYVVNERGFSIQRDIPLG